MKLVTAIRQLCRRRVLLIVALVLASLVGIAIELTSHQYTVGIASASVLVDSPRSQVADLGVDTGSDVVTLAARASLLGSVMTSSPIKDDIARLAGVPVDKLIATPPAIAGAAASPAPSVPSAALQPSDPRANLLNVSVLQSGQLPIMEVDTQAATAALAARLANASFTALQADVDSVAAADHVPALHRLVIRPFGPASSGTATRGMGPLYGVLGGIIVFVLACVAILRFPSIKEAWWASETEELGRLQADASSLGGVAAYADREHDPSSPLPDGSLGHGVLQRSERDREPRVWA